MPITTSNQISIERNMNDMQMHICKADFEKESDGQNIVRLLNEYSQDPVIYGKPLPDNIRRNIVPGLASHPTAVAWLAFCGESETAAVGVLIAIGGFSTFCAKPTLNIHDVCVTPAYQSKGIGTHLFQKAEQYAVQTGCAKLTLEVRRDNPGARRLYKKLGYAGDHEEDETLFWEKKIDE